MLEKKNRVSSVFFFSFGFCKTKLPGQLAQFLFGLFQARRLTGTNHHTIDCRELDALDCEKPNKMPFHVRRQKLASINRWHKRHIRLQFRFEYDTIDSDGVRVAWYGIWERRHLIWANRIVSVGKTGQIRLISHSEYGENVTLFNSGPSIRQ